MGLNIVQILALVVTFIFLAFMVFTKGDKNRLYIRFLLLCLPMMATPIIPGELPLSNFHILTFIFLICFYKRRHVFIKSGLTYLILFIILSIVMFLGCVTAEDLSLETLRTIIEIAAVFIFAKILIDECIYDPDFFYEVITCLKIVLITAILFLGCQFIFGLQFSLARALNPNVLSDGVTRYPGFFQDPQKFAQFLAASSFLCFIKYKGELKLAPKNYVLFILTLVAILYTGGRGGLGGWAAGFSILILFGNSKYRFSAIIVGLAFYLIIYNYHDSFAIFQREDNLADSYDFRYGIWKEAFKIFLDHKFFGIAPGNYANYVSVHNPDQFWLANNEVTYYDHPESGYLKWLTEYGAFGFISIMLLILLPLINGLLLFLKKKDISIMLLISAITSWMLGFYTIYSLGDIRILFFIVTILCLLITSYTRFLPKENDISHS